MGPWNNTKDNKTTVVHCQKKDYDVYCGRGNCPKTGQRSKFGNPFTHKMSNIAIYHVDTVEDAINEFEKWIITGDGQYLLKDLHELKGRILGCWCKPKDCHCDILALLADNFSPPTSLSRDPNKVYKCYLDGFIARYNGKSEDDNPYDVINGHNEWYCGYWDCADYLDHRKGKYN